MLRLCIPYTGVHIFQPFFCLCKLYRCTLHIPLVQLSWILCNILLLHIGGCNKEQDHHILCCNQRHGGIFGQGGYVWDMVGWIVEFFLIGRNGAGSRSHWSCHFYGGSGARANFFCRSEPEILDLDFYNETWSLVIWPVLFNQTKILDSVLIYGTVLELR